MSLSQELSRVAVNALYGAREADKVMDEAAELVAAAVLGLLAEGCEQRAESYLRGRSEALLKNDTPAALKSAVQATMCREAAACCREQAGEGPTATLGGECELSDETPRVRTLVAQVKHTAQLAQEDGGKVTASKLRAHLVQFAEAGSE